jgi:hypothetical protein
MNFTATRSEEETIVRIAERFEELCDRYGASGVMTRVELLMDIEACHSNGCPLNLRALLAATDVDLVHDVGGITTHLDRGNGTLKDEFVPRYASRRMGADRRALTSEPYRWPEVDRRHAERRQP